MNHQPFVRRRVHLLAGAICSLALLTGAGAALGAAGTGGIGTGGTGGGTTTTTSGDGVFPVRAKHTYGDGLGAGRGHEGQDILAKCGKPVVAAQPGRVAVRDYQSAAGNFVVIDGDGKLPDEVYMHMQRPASVAKGQRVEAGDVIGRVGDTGRVTACHLHFEMWSEPGWYKGGELLDPTPSLKTWDRAG